MMFMRRSANPYRRLRARIDADVGGALPSTDQPFRCGVGAIVAGRCADPVSVALTGIVPGRPASFCCVTLLGSLVDVEAR